MNVRVLTTVDADGHTEIKIIARMDNLSCHSAFGQRPGARFIANYSDAWIIFQHDLQPIDIEMIFMNVGDEDAGQFPEPFQPDRKTPRVDEQAGVGFLYQQAAMAQFPQSYPANPGTRDLLAPPCLARLLKAG